MYYYAIVDVNFIVTDVVEEVEPVDETNWLPIDSYDMDLVGMWYDIETQTYSHVGNKYLIPLKIVDGAGSGLDADKLDGQDASAFATAGHTHDGYADAEHTHDDYASANHTHTEYAPAGHAHTQYAKDADVVHKAGEEVVSGTKVFQANPTVNKSSPNVVLKVSDLIKGTKSTNASYDGVAVMDASGNALANMRYVQESDGDGYLQFKAFDYTGDASPAVDMRLYKPVGSQGYVQLPTLVKLNNGLQAIFSNGTNFQLGSASLDMLLNAKDDIIFQQRATTKGLIPVANNNHSIGSTSARYASIYLVNTPNVSSDLRLKENIEDVDAEKMLEFIDKLNVVDYNFKGESVDRIGLIAQDVEDAGGEKFIEVGEDGYYGLKTADLVYPLIGAVQALYTKVLELEAKLNQ